MVLHFGCVFFKLVIITWNKGGAKLVPGEKQFILITTQASKQKHAALKEKNAALLLTPSPNWKDLRDINFSAAIANYAIILRSN